MGIRFRCHHCEYELHVKDFQGGKRGRCPECKGSFRIPQADSEYSLPAMPEPGAVESGSVEAASSVAHAKPADSHPAHSKPAHSKPAQAAPRVMAAAHAAGGKLSGTTGRQAAAESVKASKAKRSGSATTSTGRMPENTSHSAAPDSASEPVPTQSPDDVVPGLPRSIVDYPHSIWHVRPASGGQYGPAPAELFGQWMIEGRIDRDAWVWRDDWADWQQAATVFSEFYPSVPITSGPPPLSPPASSTSLGASSRPATGSPGPLPTADSPVDAAGSPRATAVNNPRRDRRLKQRKRNMVLVAILVVIFIALVGTLVYVLLTQGDAPNP